MIIDIKFLHYYNVTIATVIGFIANLVTIYVVKTQTSKELRHYSQTLLQNCTVDLFVNVFIFMTKVVRQ